MASTVLGDGRTIQTKIVNGQTVQSINGADSVVPRDMIDRTIGDDGRVWTGDYKAPSSGGGGKSSINDYMLSRYKAKVFNALSDQQAREKASSQLSPLAELAKNRTIAIYAQEKARLPEYLNARGQVFGGARIIGENNLLGEKATKLNEMDMQNNATIAQLANQLQERSQSRADTLAAQDFNQWNAYQQLLMSKLGMDRSQTNADRSFNYGVGRDAVTDSQWQNTFDWNKDTDTRDFDYKKQQDALALQMAMQKALSGGGSGGGGGSNTGSNSGGSDPTSMAIASVYQYNTPEEAWQAYKSYSSEMAANGVDLAKVMKAMQSAFPNFAFGTNLEERRAYENAGYKFINGKWVKVASY